MDKITHAICFLSKNVKRDIIFFQKQLHNEQSVQWYFPGGGATASSWFNVRTSFLACLPACLPAFLPSFLTVFACVCFASFFAVTFSSSSTFLACCLDMLRTTYLRQLKATVNGAGTD